MNVEMCKQRKKDLHLTYDDLSNMTGLSRKTIVNFFTRSTEPRKETIEAISKALGINSIITINDRINGWVDSEMIRVIPIEVEMLEVFREVGAKRGKEAQKALIAVAKNMCN